MTNHQSFKIIYKHSGADFFLFDWDQPGVWNSSVFPKRVSGWSNHFQKEHGIMKKYFLYYSLASRRPWAAPTDLFILKKFTFILYVMQKKRTLTPTLLHFQK